MTNILYLMSSKSFLQLFRNASNGQACKASLSASVSLTDLKLK